ncbi:tyrosine-type recombinase/integrase [Aromatoleum evansii]|uniref:tyrosine-type recombinase/integrase n=1 Tax=Aromatoleum evansii TaxID=59406 RepID=UPI00145CDA78|nr:site-specific integrase [Aromatoleum evansii]NMG32371.1 DUF4102 domain-containing protein [Aromatoleum evansii]
MPKKAKELSALEVQRLTKPGLYAVGGVAGLQLQVLPTGARTWVLRVVIGGKRRDMGLGGYPDVTLSGAREKAREARALIEEGKDPIAQRAAARNALIEERRALEVARALEVTFDECTNRFLASKVAEWKNAKHAKQWAATLHTYASPTIGNMIVRDVAKPHVLKVLEPIWQSKTETASRLRGRIESVLDYAKFCGFRDGDNPAKWRNNLEHALPKPSKVATVEHHSALPYSEIGAFMRDLRKRNGIAARALEFAILTACRSGEVRGATWNEIDLDEGVWRIPAGRMKASKEHWIPLSAQAVALLKGLPREEGATLVFPAPRGGVLSDMTLGAVLRRMERGDITAHGFRSTFRDWAGETTAYPREVIEHALAHQLKDKAEAAYARGTLIDKRRRLMADWAKHCDTVQKAGDVVPLQRSNTAA